MDEDENGITLTIDPHPEFVAQEGLGHLRLGRTKPAEPAKLKLANYLDLAALPPRPTHVDYVSAVPSWPMYGNDLLGDCTWAAVGHLIEAWTKALGSERVPTTRDIEQGYWETGDPPSSTGTAGGPTDDGRVETDVLSYWRRSGVPNEGHKILAYAQVERHHFREAMWLFGGIYLGAELPLTAQLQQVWDYVPDAPEEQRAPGSWGGHAFPALAYDRHGFLVITWGFPLRMTDAFRNEYVDEGYAIITNEWLDAQGDTLAGFNLQQLQADLPAVTG